jgi:hypothetical protein
MYSDTASSDETVATVSGNLSDNWRHAAEVGFDGILTDYPLELGSMLRQRSKQVPNK